MLHDTKKKTRSIEKEDQAPGRGGKGLGGYVVSVLTRRGESGTNPGVACEEAKGASSEATGRFEMAVFATPMGRLCDAAV